MQSLSTVTGPTRMQSAVEERKEAPVQRTSWLKRIGWVGFFFFLIKGLIWLAVFFGLGKMVSG